MSSLTLARFLGEIENGARILGRRNVLVVDEAGMVGTRDIAKLVELTHTAGAKLILDEPRTRSSRDPCAATRPIVISVTYTTSSDW